MNLKKNKNIFKDHSGARWHMLVIAMTGRLRLVDFKLEASLSKSARPGLKNKKGKKCTNMNMINKKNTNILLSISNT